jgi:hypothetical protein
VLKRKRDGFELLVIAVRHLFFLFLTALFLFVLATIVSSKAMAAATNVTFIALIRPASTSLHIICLSAWLNEAQTVCQQKDKLTI